MTTWIIIHVPKCGGLTLRNAIQAGTPEERFHVFSDTHLQQPGTRHPAQDERDQDWEARIVPVLNRANTGRSREFIFGHFPVDRILPWLGKPGIRLGTVIRDPVERVISHYYWWQRWPDPAQYLSNMLHEQGWSLKEFATQPAMKDALSYFLAGVDPGAWDYIGLVDGTREGYLLRVVGLFSARTGFPITEEPEHANQNEGRTAARYPLSASIRNQIEGYHQADMLLYKRLLVFHQTMISTMSERVP